MSMEVECPFSDKILLRKQDSYSNTVTVVTPYVVTRMDDDSYGLRKQFVPRRSSDKTGYKLVQTGYQYTFPRSYYDFVPRTTVGWLSSWGTGAGSFSYSVGDDWEYTVSNTSQDEVISPETDMLAFAGRCGLNYGGTLIRGTDTTSSNRILLFRGNGSFFDYLFSVKPGDYIQYDDSTTENEDTEYWFQFNGIQIPRYTSILYSSDYKAEEKTKQAALYSSGIYYGIQDTARHLYTPVQFEYLLGIDFNTPETFVAGTRKYEWRLYGSYNYNGTTRFFECDSSIQKTVADYLGKLSLKATFNSFRDMLSATISNCGILEENVQYASLVLVELIDSKETAESARFVVEDSVLLKYAIGTDAIVSEPATVTASDILTFHTPGAICKPTFLLNRTCSIGFPAYMSHDLDITATVSNVRYDAPKDRMVTEVAVTGLFPDDLELSSTVADAVVTSTKTTFLLPSIYDRYEDPVRNQEQDTVSVGWNGKDNIPVSTGFGYLTLSPEAAYQDSGKFGNYAGKLTLGSKYPMDPVSETRFATSKVYTIETIGDSVDVTFTITSQTTGQTSSVTTSYSRQTASVSAVKLDNSKPVSIGQVVLQPYMYDATRIVLNGKDLGSKIGWFGESNIRISISDNTGGGKDAQDIVLRELRNGNYSDFLFSTGLERDYLSSQPSVEFTLYIAAYCDTGDYAGKGFRDSSVYIEFMLPELWRMEAGLVQEDYSVSYSTTLPPYIVQGTPYTKRPEEEKVLNSTITPANFSARTDYTFDSYSTNTRGYVTDALFTNSEPLYYCTASALLPAGFNGTITDIGCQLKDTATGIAYPIEYTHTSTKEQEMLVLTMGNLGSYIVPAAYTSAFTHIQVQEYEQVLDIEDKSNVHIAANSLTFSAHVSYTSATVMNTTENRIVISAE